MAIYLVSKTKTLFKSDKYSEIDTEQALQILKPLKLVQIDTETEGLDMHSKALLTLQLGNKENQVVFDWTTLSKEEKSKIKQYLESPNITLLGWNLMFDLGFLYVQNIWPKKVLDDMVVEKLLWLGYPTGMREMSLKAAAFNYLGLDLDKSVRGTIINVGLTPEVIIYAAGDVTWLEDIWNAQKIEVDKQHLQTAVDFECEFIKGLAYYKYCGVHLDKNKWKSKMIDDLKALQTAEQELNDWVVNWDKSRTTNQNWDIQYPEMNCNNSYEIEDEINKLIKNKYVRSIENDLEVPYQKEKLKAYKKKITNLFTAVNLQGDLFNGFQDGPQCIINWSSSQQVIQLFEILGIQVKTFDKKTKKEKKSVEAKLLKPQKDKFPILPIYLKYQKAAKVVSTYGENWLKAINPVTGRIHVDFYSLGTDTARVSSGGGEFSLNLQNLPHDPVTRACFTAEPNNSWISCDYQSQESRIIASVSKDAAMIELFEHGCGDVHSLVAKMSYPEIIGDCPIEEIKNKFSSYRQDAKGIE